MTVAREAEKLISDLKAVVQDGENLLRTTGHELNAKAREGLAESVASARRTCKELEGKLRVAARLADETVHEHPYTSVGIALGVGLILGALLLRGR